jgi:outer membrane protein assembly factor BamB
MMRSFKSGLSALLLAGLVSGCGTIDKVGGWFGLGGGSEAPLPGERIAVLQGERSLQVDDAIANREVLLPRPFVNPDWPQSGGYPSFAMHHLETSDLPQVVWRVSVGEGSGSDRQVIAPPVVAQGRVFLKDAASGVSALDAGTGKLIWRADVSRKSSRDREGFGGGVAFFGGRLFVSTGSAQVIALDPADGKEIWRSNVSGPVRGAPTVFADRVFVVSIDNQTHALSAVDGNDLWSHTGLSETAGLLGGTSPAAAADIVVAPYSSGELTAMRLETGRVLWSENLITARRADSVSNLADISGRPVIDRGRVIAVGNAGIMAAIDQRSGARLWDKPIGGTQTPWVAGDWIYVLSNNAEVVALAREDGRIRWVTALQRYRDEQRKRDPLRWLGPVLAGDRLLIAGASGQMLALSPYDGRIIGTLNIGTDLTMPPIVANKTIYLLTNNADLIALR